MRTKTRNEVQNNLTIYRNFTHTELQSRADKHKEKFEEKCKKQGYYLPSDSEMDRWFTVQPFTLGEEA